MEREKGRKRPGEKIKRHKLLCIKYKPQGYIVQHKEYNQDFIITINEV